MSKKTMSRVYRIQKIGRSYYIALPKVLVRKKMLEQGVIIEVYHVSDDSIILELRVANAVKEYNKNNKESGENPSKSRTANNIR